MARMLAYTKESDYKGDLIALTAGILLPFAFAPFELFFIALLSPGLLLFSCINVSPLRAFCRGGLFGLGLFGVGVSWVYVSLHIYGEANEPLAAGITALLIFIMLLFPACMSYVLVKFFSKNILSKFLVAFPSLWALFEWIRTWFLTGFPWLLLGNSQIDTPLAGFAPIASVYAVSWVTAFISALLMVIIIERKNYRLLLSFLSVIVIGGTITSKLWDRPWTHIAGEPITVSLIQGNIPQSIKWRQDQAEKSLLLYQTLTSQNLKSQLIVWPEAAITFPQNRIQGFLNSLDQQLKANGVTLITGIPAVEDNQYHNAMIALGKGEGSYYKRHLVPFGEYIPFRSWLNWLDGYLQIPMSDFKAGKKYQALITAGNIPIVSSICYEIAYPTSVLKDLPEGQLLVTVSDDSWFGKSLAPAQHFQMARMRALETGRYVLMATNDGITGIINPLGKIQSQAEPFKTVVLTGQVYPYGGRTPWMYTSIYPLLLLLLILLGVAWREQRKFKVDL
ncbi:MAG: lnt [Gammaproteobacteria bacterium]|jgi:apolipoprotein N-acyltransferase|nr:lnt [Gammaproteobacteria bacterium]